MSKPVTPLDSELAKIFGNNTRIFRAMRELFKQAGDLSPTAIEEALIAGSNAGTAANQALDVIERLTQAVELLALMPRDTDNIRDDDLAPRQEFIIPETLADLSPRNEEDPTILKEADIGDTVQAFSAALDTYAANSLTSDELGELQNINSVTITNAQWAFVGAFNQGLTTTSDVTFDLITATDKVDIQSTQGETFLVGGSLNVLNFGLSVSSFDGVISFASEVSPTVNGAYVSTVSTSIGRSAIRFGDDIIFQTASATVTPIGNVVTLITALTINSSQNVAFEGTVSTNDTTESTSAITGSIQTDGGLGVVKNIHGGGDLTIDSGGEVFLNLPTVGTGTSGSLWDNSGVVNVVP